jgi:hypothetical protein|tara:strand:+ start:709 stop:1011 length:303 start_codon:yes stop_codon:yes gene_type:complete
MDTQEIKYFTFSALLTISERAKKQNFSNIIKPETLIKKFKADTFYPVMYDFYHENVLGGFFRCAITDGKDQYLMDVDLKDYRKYIQVANLPKKDLKKTIN